MTILIKHEIDTCGTCCPVPMISTIKTLNRLQKGDIIIRDENEITDVELPTKKFFQLKIGDVVERQLRNGDIVLLNRQPTLHKASMLAKRVIIRPYKTFRFALASTKSFNADMTNHH